jgi:hypothetical protein
MISKRIKLRSGATSSGMWTEFNAKAQPNLTADDADSADGKWFLPDLRAFAVLSPNFVAR